LAIVEISKAEFDALNVGERCYSLWASKQESAWLRDDAGHVLGLVHFDNVTQLYGYSICVRSEDGGFSRVAMGADIPNHGWASRILRETMAKLYRVGAHSRPRRLRPPGTSGGWLAVVHAARVAVRRKRERTSAYLAASGDVANKRGAERRMKKAPLIPWQRRLPRRGVSQGATQKRLRELTRISRRFNAAKWRGSQDNRANYGLAISFIQTPAIMRAHSHCKICRQAFPDVTFYRQRQDRTWVQALAATAAAHVAVLTVRAPVLLN
jgi:hypothetical protein